jgi:hypothetical protein
MGSFKLAGARTRPPDFTHFSIQTDNKIPYILLSMTANVLVGGDAGTLKKPMVTADFCQLSPCLLAAIRRTRRASH